IVQDSIVSTRSGKFVGQLVTDSTWIAATGEKLLAQRTTYTFSKAVGSGEPEYVIDMVITLKALTPVVFHDDKEGMLGMRVAHFLESPTEKGGIFLDANGKETKVAAADPA